MVLLGYRPWKASFWEIYQPSEWAKPCLLIPYWSRVCIFYNPTAVYCSYFKWQNCLRQSPCHGMVLAVPRLRWMMYICFPVRQKADFVFKLSTEKQEGFKTCVVMVQALQKHLCNHHLTVEILSAAAALLHGACYHRSLLKLCYPQARAQLWILVGWLKHVASPHKTRVCDFIFLPSSEQLLNNSLGGKKMHAFHIDTWEQCSAALVSPGSRHPVLLPVWNKLVIESRPL